MQKQQHCENEVVYISEDSDEGEVTPGYNVTTQSPTVFVEGSSDIHIGPHIQYHAPVTIKQYVTVKNKDLAKLANGANSLSAALQINGIKLPEKIYSFDNNCKLPDEMSDLEDFDHVFEQEIRRNIARRRCRIRYYLRDASQLLTVSQLIYID
ncbi:hypothetical protein L9F63_011228, partial [Diploptera punctata]